MKIPRIYLWQEINLPLAYQLLLQQDIILSQIYEITRKLILQYYSYTKMLTI